MEKEIRILHLEDDARDAELVCASLASGGIPHIITLVQSSAEFIAALCREEYDLILADYKLPGYDGMSALSYVRKNHPEIPFIFVSGTLGEDAAIQALTEGATDYVYKQKLTRLAPAVIRTIHDAENQKERRQAEEAAKKRLSELEILHNFSVDLRTARTSKEALPILLERTLSTLETNAGIIWLYNPEKNELHAAVSRGWFQQVEESPIKPDEGIAGMVFSSGQPYISIEFRNDPYTRSTTREQLPPGWGGICLPIRTGDVNIGVLFVSVPPEHPVSTEHTQLLESLTEMAGAALHRMSLFEETINQLGQLQSLHKIDQAISASTNLTLTLNVILEHVASQLKVDAADVLLLNPLTLDLEFVSGRGFYTNTPQNVRLRLGESFAGRVALERCSLVITNPELIRESPQFATFWYDEKFVTYCAEPLIVKGQVKGVLELFHREPLAIEQKWINFFETLAGQTAIAIENAQLFENLQRSNIELVQAYDATIEGWVRALDLRDRETEGHTLRVTKLTERLARAMNIAEGEIVHIRRGALLHDIGKMGIPDNILLKPGALTKEEWEIMRQHPQYAFDMLTPISFLRPAIDIPFLSSRKMGWNRLSARENWRTNSIGSPSLCGGRCLGCALF